MEAQEARSKAIESRIDELDDVLQLIKTAAAEGKMSITLKEVSPAVIEALLDLKYAVEWFYIGHRELLHSVTIKWNQP